MADCIRIETDCFDELSLQLNRVAASLSALEGALRNVHLSPESGADVQVHELGGLLQSVGYSLRSGTAQNCIRNLSVGIGQLEDRARRLSRSSCQAGECFLQNERHLAQTFENLAVPPSVLQDMGAAQDNGTWYTARSGLRHLQNLRTIVNDSTRLVTAQGIALLYANNQLLASLAREGSAFTYKAYSDSNGTKAVGPYTGAEASAATSAWYKEGSYDNGKLSAQGSVNVFTAEAHVSGEAGFGIHQEADGSYSVTMGAKGDVGASFAAFEAQGSMDYELMDSVNLGLEGEISVLQGETSLNGGIGIVDGEFMASVSGTAEVNLIKGGVSANVNVGGIEGKIGADVFVGAGAHATAGYEDGVLSYDIGAGLGLGVSIKGEINVEQAVSKVGEAVLNAGKAVTAWLF